MRITGRLPYWAILTLMAVTALLLLVVPEWREWKWDHGISGEAGKALLISAALGFTIDRWMKTQIAEDVFKAAFGYAMPQEFQEEIRRLLSFKFMCVHHEMWYDLKPLPDGCVSVNVRISRRLQNIGNSPELRAAYIAIDEWGFENSKSSISRCEIIDDANNKIMHLGVTEREDAPRMHAKTKDVIVRAGGTITVVNEFTEIRRNNDHITSVFLTPTANPIFHVSANGFSHELDFGVIDPSYGKSEISDTYTLNGVYFPPGNVRLRWWPKNQPNLPTFTE